MSRVEPDYDVVIVGAGPAGSTTAKCLLDQQPQAKVLLVDKAEEFPRDKPCGGYVGAEIVEAFPYLKGREGHFSESESYQGILHSPDLRYQVGGRTRMFGVLRSTFDAYLVGLAQQAGAHLGIRSHVIDVKLQSQLVSVNFSDGRQITSRVIVGADGAASLVARRTGLHERWQSHEVCRTIVKDFKVDPSFIIDNYGPDRPVHLFLKFNQIPGYAWVFPKAYHINVGLGCFASYPIRLMEYFQLLIRICKNWKMLPDNATTRNISAGICPTVGPIATTQNHRVLLVGDAAGFVSPSTGAGIVPGMISGKLAAETLTEAISHQRFDADFLNRYQTRWENQIGRFETELMIQRVFLTRWCNLFIRIGEKDAGIRQFIASAQSKDPMGRYGPGTNILELLLRVLWALLKGPFGRL